MKILLGTCSFLWFVNGDLNKISKKAKDVFLDDESDIYLSAVSCWEISIKWSIGKLELKQTPNLFLKTQIWKNQISILAINLEHALKVADLPFHHHDPFDRLLISQAIVENIPIVSSDKTLLKYPIQRIW